MVIRHGEQVDWRKTDIGSMALYASGGERAMDGETMVQGKVVLYFYIIHVTVMSCSME
jgi:hypothetical protein